MVQNQMVCSQSARTLEMGWGVEELRKFFERESGGFFLQICAVAFYGQPLKAGCIAFQCRL